MERPIVIIGGWLSTVDDYRGMARILASPPYNRIVYITDIQRREWARLRDPDFRLVLDILARTVETAQAETGADKVDIIGHSAGGRIARAYLGDQPYYDIVYDGQRRVASLTTLGTAHHTVEIYVAQFGKWVNEVYPGAHFPNVHYRSVAGRSVTGRRFSRPEEMLAYRSYELVGGEGSTVGDGVIPTAACYLDGAENLVLVGVRHSPYNAPRTWYGAPGVIPAWFDNDIGAAAGARSVTTRRVEV